MGLPSSDVFSTMEVVGTEMGKPFYVMTWDFQDGTSKVKVSGNEMGKEIYTMTWDFQVQMCFPRWKW